MYVCMYTADVYVYVLTFWCVCVCLYRPYIYIYIYVLGSDQEMFSDAYKMVPCYGGSIMSLQSKVVFDITE